jgi:predicted Rossmann fold nucleotide-binding protein DprA/Smf involved in DNA uptake
MPLPDRATRNRQDGGAGAVYAIGNAALFQEPLLGILASRGCPGTILIDTLELIPGWVLEGRVVLSGFHSPLEQQVLRSTLRRRGRVVKVLARGMRLYHPAEEEREALTDGAMWVITAFTPDIQRTSRRHQETDSLDNRARTSPTCWTQRTQ